MTFVTLIDMFYPHFVASFSETFLPKRWFLVESFFILLSIYLGFGFLHDFAVLENQTVVPFSFVNSVI